MNNHLEVISVQEYLFKFSLFIYFLLRCALHTLKCRSVKCLMTFAKHIHLGN